MASRTVLKPRPRPRQAPAWFARHPALVMRGVTGAIVLVAGLFFTWGVRQWYAKSLVAAREQCLLPVKERFSRNFDALWYSCPPVPRVVTGDEPDVLALLRAEPSVEAVVSRRDGRVWVRSGPRLALRPDAPRCAFYRALAASLDRAGSDFLSPAEDQDPDLGWCFRVAISAGDWVVIKGVEPGSPELDNELARVLGPVPDLRVNLQHMQPVDRPGQVPGNHRETPYQIPEAEAGPATWAIGYWNRNQTPGWVWVSVPSGALRAAMRMFFLRRMLLLVGPILLLAGMTLYVLRVRRIAARQAALAKDRLASITHGLKTPLAVIKAWCDASRHGRMDKDQTDLLLIRIGEQVDQLAAVIQNGLQTLRPEAAAAPGTPVTPAWLQELAAEFHEVCDEAGRAFETRLDAGGAPADRISLQQVLQTFLDNALLHGRGTIRLASAAKGKRLLLTVEDQGPGLDPLQLKQLGTPFTRFRRPGAEGFEAPGMGLGLCLAIRIAEKEGWGLRFQSAPEAGFAATLELPG